MKALETVSAAAMRQLFGDSLDLARMCAAQETPERTCRRGGVPNGSACRVAETLIRVVGLYPVNWARTNWSYGRSSLRALMTQSRQR